MCTISSMCVCKKVHWNVQKYVHCNNKSVPFVFFLHQKRAVNLLCFVTIPDIEWRDHLNVMLWWSICAFYFVLCAKHRFFFLSQNFLKFDTIDPILITYCKILYACFWSSIGVKHWLRPANINICIRTDKNACCCFLFIVYLTQNWITRLDFGFRSFWCQKSKIWYVFLYLLFGRLYSIHIHSMRSPIEL